MSFEQGTSAEDIFKDPLQEMARIWRIMRRRWQNFKGRISNRRTPQQVLSRAALEAFRDRGRHDPSAARRLRDLDPRDLHAQLDRHNRAEVRNLDLDGNGVDDRTDARNRDLDARNGRLLDDDGAAPAVIDADSFEVRDDRERQDDRERREGRDDRAQEERREERRDGIDAGTAVAAGTAAAVVANEVDDRLDADQDEARAETGAQADNQRQAETDTELETQADNQVGSAEQDQRFVNPDGSLNPEALDGIAEDTPGLAQDEQDFETAMNEAGERGVQAAEYEAAQARAEGLYADDGDLSTENEVDDRVLEEDGSARPVIGAENVRAEPQFVNNDTSVNQEALNGIQEETEQDRADREQLTEQQVTEPELAEQQQVEREQAERQEAVREPGQAEVGGFATGGDHASAAEVEEATARDVATGTNGQVREESGQETLDRVIAEERERQDRNGQQPGQSAGGRGDIRQDPTFQKVAALYQDGGALPAEGALRPVDPAEVGSGARNPQQRRQQEVTAGRSGQGEERAR